jgi:hypothetical protein
LIDKLGGLQEAIDQVAQDADLEKGNYEVRVLPPPKSPIESLMESLSGDGGADDEGRLMSLAGGDRSPRSLLLDAARKYVNSSQSPRSKAARLAVTLLEVLGQEQVSLHMPMISIGDR